MIEKVFAFLYCSCIHESGYQTVSLHRTRKGAETAMEFHREEARKEHLNLYSNEEYKKFEVEFGTTEKWEVEELKILE